MADAEEWTGMSLDELKFRLRMARAARFTANPYVVSADVYNRMVEAVGHFVSTGALPPNSEDV